MSSYGRDPSLLEWDSKHFGFPIASVGPQESSDIPQAVGWAKDEEVRLMMARCDAANSDVVHALERAGFLLMDTFVRYDFEFGTKKLPKENGKALVRSFKPDDVSSIEAVARRSFQNYIGHFHNDPRLPKDRSDAVYSEWAANSCRDKRLADDVLVAVHDGDIVGFATMKGINAEAAEGILFGVDPKAQGQGIYRSFMVHGMQWSQSRGFKKLEVGTQVNNYPVQRVWQRLGFEIRGSGHTFHLWIGG
jgi:GNAT superfamily N-acetyltransferase